MKKLSSKNIFFLLSFLSSTALARDPRYEPTPQPLPPCNGRDPRYENCNGAPEQSLKNRQRDNMRLFVNLIGSELADYYAPRNSTNSNAVRLSDLCLLKLQKTS